MKVTLCFVLLTMATSRGTVAQSLSVSSQVLPPLQQQINSMVSSIPYYQTSFQSIGDGSGYFQTCAPGSVSSGKTLAVGDINQINQICSAFNKTSLAIYNSTTATVTAMNQAFQVTVTKMLNNVLASLDPLVKVLDVNTNRSPQLITNVTSAIRIVLKSAASQITQLCLKSTAAMKTILNNGIGELNQQLEGIAFQSILLSDSVAGDTLRQQMLQAMSTLTSVLASSSIQYQEQMCTNSEYSLISVYDLIRDAINNAIKQ